MFFEHWFLSMIPIGLCLQVQDHEDGWKAKEVRLEAAEAKICLPGAPTSRDGSATGVRCFLYATFIIYFLAQSTLLRRIDLSYVIQML